MKPSIIPPPGYETLSYIPLPTDATFGHMNTSKIVSLVLENQQLKLKLDASTSGGSIAVDRLSEYMMLLQNVQAKFSRAEYKRQELEKERDTAVKEMTVLKEACQRYETELSDLGKQLEENKSRESCKTEVSCTPAKSHKPQNGTALDLEFKPVYRSPEDMIQKRFDILASLPVPLDIPLGILKPIGIPERFTLHEFLLGSASGSLRNALSGYCAFTENTTMWCPQREEHGFYLTPLYKCDTGPRSNVIHRWMKVDIKARMSKPTGKEFYTIHDASAGLTLAYSECFYQKEGEWYYTGTYQSIRLEDLTPMEYDNLSQASRDALVKETLAGRKNSTPQVIFETSQLYAAGALKVAVVGIQCIGFNHMLYSVALQQAQRFQTNGRPKATVTQDVSIAGDA